MSENPFNDLGLVDECDDTHRGTAVSALQRIDLVNLLNQPGPVGFALTINRRVVDDSGGCGVVVLYN